MFANVSHTLVSKVETIAVRESKSYMLCNFGSAPSTRSNVAARASMHVSTQPFSDDFPFYACFKFSSAFDKRCEIEGALWL